jgi:dienelactone hydrolase
MPRALRTLTVLLLAFLLPLRAVASVTIGYCAAGHQELAVAAHGDHGQVSGSHARHGGDEQPAKPATPSCSICVEHCSGAAFAPSADQAVSAPAVAQDPVLLAERVAPAFFPDQLDRPPLASLR